MPFNKIAELGAEIGKAQLILEQKDAHIKHLQEELEKRDVTIKDLHGRMQQISQAQAADKRPPGRND